MAREYLHNKHVKRWLSRLLWRRQWFCQLYDHTYLVDINKEIKSPTVMHILYCGHCRTIFGNMSFPYTAYSVKTVNPQYSDALFKWFSTIGLRDPVSEELVSNIQKFRNREIRPFKAPKKIKGSEDINVNHLASQKSGSGPLQRFKRAFS